MRVVWPLELGGTCRGYAAGMSGVMVRAGSADAGAAGAKRPATSTPDTSDRITFTDGCYGSPSIGSRLRDRPAGDWPRHVIAVDGNRRRLTITAPCNRAWMGEEPSAHAAVGSAKPGDFGCIDSSGRLASAWLLGVALGRAALARAQVWWLLAKGRQDGRCHWIAARARAASAEGSMDGLFQAILDG